jgi:uracil-DNA glycosylase
LRCACTRYVPLACRGRWVIMKSSLQNLLKDVRGCSVCKEHLPVGPRPIVSISASCKVIIIGQAPGTKVHESGIPWDDASGERLRIWMGIDRGIFYDSNLIGIMPMGFCYPGKGNGGDMPPRPECAPLWHSKLLDHCSNVRLTLLIGQYSQSYYLRERRKGTLTETVKAYEEYMPRFIPLVHPSPRNQIWLKKNPWFETTLIPILRRRIQRALKS